MIFLIKCHARAQLLKTFFSLSELKRALINIIIQLKSEPYYLNLVRFIDCIIRQRIKIENKNAYNLKEFLFSLMNLT